MMNTIKGLCLPLILSTLAACSGGGNSNNGIQIDNREPLNLSFTEAPIELPGISADYAEDVPYGDKERNLFDIYLPDCDEPTPLVIFIHGGGFTDGDKSGAAGSGDVIREFLQSCVAYAAINYTLLVVPSNEEGTGSIVAQGGVLTSLRDTALALQFMRHHSESLNLNPEMVATYGGSAGAGAGLWLGTHDDMADPGNEDPVLRESTRVKAVGALNTQSTYDILGWESVLLPFTQQFADLLGGTDVVTLASAVGATNYLLTFLGVDALEGIYSPENEAYRANIDMLGLMDSSDAPIYVENYETGLDNLLNLFLHHGLHALAIKARADEVGLESVGYVRDPAYPLEDPSGESMTSFLLRHIN